MLSWLSSCHTPWQHEFDPWNSHTNGRKEPVPQSCSLASRGTPWYTFPIYIIHTIMLKKGMLTCASESSTGKQKDTWGSLNFESRPRRDPVSQIKMNVSSGGRLAFTQRSELIHRIRRSECRCICAEHQVNLKPLCWSSTCLCPGCIRYDKRSCYFEHQGERILQERGTSTETQISQMATLLIETR